MHARLLFPLLLTQLLIVQTADARSLASTKLPMPPAKQLSPNRKPQPVFDLDPITDGSIFGVSLAFGLTLELIIRTGEIRPQSPGDPDRLLSIDRWRATNTNTSDQGLSNVGLGLMIAWAATDTILTQALGRGDPWYNYLTIYAETVSITLALTGLAKIAVRRPRPIAYHIAAQQGTTDSTDSALSFFSGHTSITASLAATATYLAFTRPAAPTWEKWLIATGGFAATTFVAVNRVVEGKHFPTDVLAGFFIGAAVGVLVPHFHRKAPEALRGLHVGFSRPLTGGGVLSLGGTL